MYKIKELLKYKNLQHAISTVEKQNKGLQKKGRNMLIVGMI